MFCSFYSNDLCDDGRDRTAAVLWDVVLGVVQDHVPHSSVVPI